MKDEDWPGVKVWLNEEHNNGYSIAVRGLTDPIIIGILEWHRNSDGNWCGGHVGFNTDPEIGTKPRWRHTGDVETGEGFTLYPSILCRRCGTHGWIRDGKWVPA